MLKDFKLCYIGINVLLIYCSNLEFDYEYVQLSAFRAIVFAAIVFGAFRYLNVLHHF